LLFGCTGDEAALVDSLARARDHLSRRQYAPALEAFDEVLAIDPSHFDARRLKAEIFYNTARLAEAEKLLVVLREEAATNLDVLWGLAMVYKDRMRFAEALTLFESLPLKDRPPVPMAETLTGVGRHDAAANWLGQHLAADPFDSKSYYLLSKIEFRRGRESQGQFWGDFYRGDDKNRADDGTARGMEFHGKPLEGMLFRARSLCQRGRWFDGMQEATRVLRSNQNVPLAYFLIGQVMAFTGNSTDAVKALTSALAIDAGNPTATKLLADEKKKLAASGGKSHTPLDAAKRFVALGEHDQARAAALFAAQSRPEDLSALRLVAEFFNRPQDAFVRLWAWQRAVALAPEDAALRSSRQAELTKLGMKF
jgi:tetratricopeptide (TPR) repeat protein